MDDNFVKKGIVILVGLIVITYGVNWLMHRIHAYEEMHKPPTPTDPIIEGLWLPPEWFYNILTQLQIIIAQIGTYMGMALTMSIYAVVLLSLQGIAVGIFNHFKCGGEWFGYGFANGIQALGIMIKCTADTLGKIANGDCIRFYIVDLIYGLIYFIGSAVLSIIWTITGVDLKPIIGIGWNLTVVPLDTIIFSMTGHNITRWSDATHRRCYRCEAEFAPDGKNKKNYDQLNIYDWGKVFWCSMDEMSEGIYKMVTAVVPSRKWSAWAKNEHQDGWDNDPPFAA